MSASTRYTPMTTSDPGLAAVPAPAPAQDAGEAQQTGESLSATMAVLLNPMVIARMANEFFAAVPGSPAAPATTLPPAPPATILASAPPATPPVDLGALPVASAIPPASAFAPPTEAGLRPLPATVTGATGLPLPAATAPDSPVGPYAFRPELVPSLLFASSPVSLPSAPSVSAVASAPPAAVTEPAAASAGSSFYFLEGIPSTPYTTPTFPLEPYGFDPAMLPDLGLTAGPYDPRITRRDFPNL